MFRTKNDIEKRVRKLEKRVQELENQMYIKIYPNDWLILSSSIVRVNLQKVIDLILDHLALRLDHTKEKEIIELKKVKKCKQ